VQHSDSLFHQIIKGSSTNLGFNLVVLSIDPICKLIHTLSGLISLFQMRPKDNSENQTNLGQKMMQNGN
jgi:hypothetical protein